MALDRAGRGTMRRLFFILWAVAALPAASLAQPPQRIAVAGKASFMIADALYLFPGARARVVARSGGTTLRSGADDFLARFDATAPEPVSLIGNAGVEPIAAARPDLVLLKSSSSQLAGDLARLGIPAVTLDFEMPEHYARDLDTLGRALGAEDRARELAAYYESVLEYVRRNTASLDSGRRPRTLLIQYSERGGMVAFSVPPAEWIQTRLVELAGGLPIWKDAAARGGWTVVNLEQIAAWDPDVVLVVSYAAPADGAVAAILADGRWAGLRAARNGTVFAFPGDFRSWDQPDTRWPLGLLWTATRLQPELFRDADLPAEVIRFYSLYGLDEATVRTEILPMVGEGLAVMHER